MIDKIKSLLLLILVLGSLVQSYYLAYSKPQFERINETAYIPAQLLGTKEEAENLIFPNEILVYSGNVGPTLFYPNHIFYSEIFVKLRQRQFDGFRQIEQTSWNQEQFNSEYIGIELRFAPAMPASLLGASMQINESQLENRNISRIWIVSRPNLEEVRAFFLDDPSGDIFEAVRTDLTVQDISQFTRFGNEYQPSYQAVNLVNATVFIPEQAYSMTRITYPFETFTSDQLQKKLFVNPGVTKKLIERDGSEIYTDGKRGLQINHEHHWMAYTDPIASVNDPGNIVSDLYTSVQFINQNGGWNGKYKIEKHTSELNQDYVFRQYVESYPVISQGADHGYIHIAMNNGTVSNYERTLIKPLTSKAAKEPVNLPGGQALLDKLENHQYSYLIKSLFPAYRPYIADGTITYEPVWAVSLGNGVYDYLQ